MLAKAGIHTFCLYIQRYGWRACACHYEAATVNLYASWFIGPLADPHSPQFGYRSVCLP
jgi:hypothetical protein